MASSLLIASSPAFFRKKAGKGSELGEGEAKKAGPAYSEPRSAKPTVFGRISGSGPKRLVEQRSDSSPSDSRSSAGGWKAFNSSPRFRIVTSSMTRGLRGRISASPAFSLPGGPDFRPGRGGLSRVGFTSWGGGDGRPGRVWWSRPAFGGRGGEVVEEEGERGAFLREVFTGSGGRDPKASRWRRFFRQSWDRRTAVPIML